MIDKEAIQRGVLAALGHVKLDYRSPKRLDEAAGVIADFVVAELEREPKAAADEIEKLRAFCREHIKTALGEGLHV